MTEQGMRQEADRSNFQVSNLVQVSSNWIYITFSIDIWRCYRSLSQRCWAFVMNAGRDHNRGCPYTDWFRLCEPASFKLSTKIVPLTMSTFFTWLRSPAAREYFFSMWFDIAYYYYYCLFLRQAHIFGDQWALFTSLSDWYVKRTIR